MSEPSPNQDVAQVLDRVREMTREHERLFHDLVAGQRRYRALARSVWSIQEGERRRLARELHDGIGQTLTALKHRLEALRSLPAPSAPEVALGVDDALTLASQALEETRELSRLLRPQILDDLGLEPALRWLVRTVGESSGLQVSLRVRGLEAPIDAELETLAFRIAQEALNNAAKHAGARTAEVAVASGNGRLRVEISDDGRGFLVSEALRTTEGVSGSGLRGMRDRVEIFGGRLAIRSEPGAGCRVEAEVPVTLADADRSSGA